MKTNEAPEKIWRCNDADSFWKYKPDSGSYIEYTRTDVFIEKTCEWLKNNVEKYYYLDEAYDKVISIKNLNNDFKNYMREESDYDRQEY